MSKQTRITRVRLQRGCRCAPPGSELYGANNTSL